MAGLGKRKLSGAQPGRLGRERSVSGGYLATAACEFGLIDRSDHWIRSFD